MNATKRALRLVAATLSAFLLLHESGFSQDAAATVNCKVVNRSSRDVTLTSVFTPDTGQPQTVPPGESSFGIVEFHRDRTLIRFKNPAPNPRKVWIHWPRTNAEAKKVKAMYVLFTDTGRKFYPARKLKIEKLDVRADEFDIEPLPTPIENPMYCERTCQNGEVVVGTTEVPPCCPDDVGIDPCGCQRLDCAPVSIDPCCRPRSRCRWWLW